MFFVFMSYFGNHGVLRSSINPPLPPLQSVVPRTWTSSHQGESNPNRCLAWQRFSEISQWSKPMSALICSRFS